MRLPLLAAAAITGTLLAGGCSTPTEIMATSTPTTALDTSLSLDQVKDCLIESNPTFIQVTAFKGGYIINQMTKGFLGPQDPVVWTARITPTGTGTHVETFKNYAGQFYDMAVTPCLEKLPKV